MRLLLMSGSLRTNSYNTAMVNFLAQELSKNTQIKPFVFKNLSSIPSYSPDFDLHDETSDDSPPEVVALRNAIKSCDALFIATPEYAFEIPGALKNALDWLISSGELVDKKVLAISSSTSAQGGVHAYKVLVALLKVLSAKTYEENPLNIDRVNKKIDSDGSIADENLKKTLLEYIKILLD